MLPPFLDAIAEAQAQRPWDLADIAGTALAQRLEPLLMRRGDAWLGPIQFRRVTDLALLRVTLEGTGEVFVDVRTELEGILAAFRARAGWLVGGTGAVMLLALWAGLRRRRACCGWWPPWWQRKLCTLALRRQRGAALVHPSRLPAAGRRRRARYALFMAREGLDMEERARTLRTLITATP